MAPVSHPLSVITNFTSKNNVESAAPNSQLLASPYCFYPFLNSSQADAPLILWVSLTILIIPVALVPALFYLGPKFFTVQIGWRLLDDACSRGEVINLSQGLADPSAITTCKARLLFCVGLACSTLTLGMLAIQGLAAAGIQLCSGTLRASGIWAAPWIEVGIVSGGLTAIAIWSTWTLSKHWRKAKRRDAKGKYREVTDEESASGNGDFRTVTVELQDMSTLATGPARSSRSQSLPPVSRCRSSTDMPDDESRQPGFASGSGSGSTSRKESGNTAATKTSNDADSDLKEQQYERRRIIKLSPEEVTALNQENDAHAMKLSIEGKKKNDSPRSSSSTESAPTLSAIQEAPMEKIRSCSERR